MSDQPGDRDRDEPEDDGAEAAADETGFGLTEEFARIEAEIEAEIKRVAPTPEGTPEEPRDEDDGEPPAAQVRVDDEDSGEWPAPIHRETGEGAVAGDEAAAVADEPDGTGEAPAGGGGDEHESDLEGPADPEPGEAGSSSGEDPDPREPPAQQPEPTASEHTVVRPRPLTPIAAAGAGSGASDPPGEEITIKIPSLWLRFVAGSVVIVLAVATAVAMSSLLFLTDVAAKLRPVPGVQDKLTDVESDEPQTIMILGSDKRPGDESGRSDTTMLLRLDPENDVLSLFSLPRDLRVDVPGIGETKLNEAYSAGGPELTLETVKNLTGLEINHVVNVNFQGFADAVDAIGCVYIDVDRDYFNDNSTAFSEAETYSEIDINSGYQRLCGLKALQYVRYRHLDTDIVRSARQQDFLREARQKVQPNELLFNGAGNDLIDVFTKYTRSSLGQENAADVIGVLKSFIAVRNVPIKQVHFSGDLADISESGIAFVSATSEQIEKAVEQFLGEKDTQGPRGGDEATDESGAEEIAKPEKDPDGSDKRKDPTKDAAVADADPKVFDFLRTSDRRLKFPVFVPTLLAAKGAAFSTYDPGSRQYEIKDEEDEKQPAYKMVVEYTIEGAVPEYYGVQGTTWNDPPVLNDPSESRTIEGRDYDLYYDGDRLRMVAWSEQGNSYWISNTLSQTLDEAQMLAIAASVKKEDN